MYTASSSSALNSNSIASGGEIISQGSGPITQKGVIWSIDPSTIDISLTTKTSDGIGTGSYTSNITGLQPNTLYYIKAYAKNNYGVGYGNLVGILTLQGGDKQCAIQGMDAYEGSSPLGVRWYGQFNLNNNCQTYKVDVSLYPSDPTNNPNLQPIRTYIINGANPLQPTMQDIQQGFVKLLMKPQPSGVDPIFGRWFSLNVKCNGTCLTNPVTKYYFYVAPQ